MGVFLCITAWFIFALPFIVSSSATLMAMFTDDTQQSTIQGSWNIFLIWWNLMYEDFEINKIRGRFV